MAKHMVSYGRIIMNELELVLREHVCRVSPELDFCIEYPLDRKAIIKFDTLTKEQQDAFISLFMLAWDSGRLHSNTPTIDEAVLQPLVDGKLFND